MLNPPISLQNVPAILFKSYFTLKVPSFHVIIIHISFHSDFAFWKISWLYFFIIFPAVHLRTVSLFHWYNLTFTHWKWQPVQFGVAEELNISGITEFNAMCIDALSPIEKSYSERMENPGSSTRRIISEWICFYLSN